MAELYDGFTFNCLSWLEGLGFCGIGEAKDFLDGGKAIARDGVIPLNTHGGQLSHGRTHGMGLIHEAVVQLRGDAGERQVKDARVGVVSSGGLTPSGAILLRTDGDERAPTAPTRRPGRRRADVRVGRLGAGAQGRDRRGARRRDVGGVFRLPRPSRAVAAARGGRRRLHGDRAGPPRLRASALLPRRHDRCRTGGSASRSARSTRSSARVPAAQGFSCWRTPRVASSGCGWRSTSERIDVLGVELAGTGLRYGEEAKAVISEATATSRPAGLRDLLWQPTDLYPPEVLTGGLSAPGAPYEAEVTANWPRRDFAEIAARVTVPVEFSVAEHERVWESTPRGRPGRRGVVHVVAAGRGQRNARQRTQSQRRLERRRIPPAGAVVRRGMCRPHGNELEAG